MDMIPFVGDLQVEQDLPHERREWMVERAGWIGIGALLIAALAGLLGPGPLSHRELHDPSSSLRVKLEGLPRCQSPTTLQIDAKVPNPADGALRLCVERRWLDAVTIREIQPEPKSQELDADRVIYQFVLVPGATLGHVTIHYEPRSPGSVRGQLGIDGGPMVEMTQFYLP